MKHLRRQHPSIVCPGCGTPQTGIVKIASETIQFADNGWIKEGGLYIQCMRSNCNYIILSVELDEVLSSTIKAPGDIRNIPNYKL